jgi:hypothetical protein
MLAGHQGVSECDAGIADMEIARGARSEAKFHDGFLAQT